MRSTWQWLRKLLLSCGRTGKLARLASLESGKPFDHTASQIAVLLIAGAVVTEEMIQLRDTIRDVLFSNAVDYIEMFSGVKVIEA